jgi:leucyl-tRNA synthetase
VHLQLIELQNLIQFFQRFCSFQGIPVEVLYALRKLLEKKIPGSKKANKQGAFATPLKENKITCLIFVNEQFDGWKAECLSILQNKFNKDTRAFAPHSEILEAIRQSSVGQSFDFKQIQKICNPFLMFKKDEAIALGEQALDFRLPFGEIEVLRENKDFIKRQISSKDLVVQDVEILSAADADSVAKAGSLSSLNQNPPSPGVPTVIFLTQ